MQNVFYAGAVFTTGDDLARAFLDVVLRVTVTGRAEKVAVPCRGGAGVASNSVTSIATVVVVPGVAAASLFLPDDHDELVDAEAVRQLLVAAPTSRAIPYDTEEDAPGAESSYNFDEWI